MSFVKQVITAYLHTVYKSMFLSLCYYASYCFTLQQISCLYSEQSPWSSKILSILSTFAECKILNGFTAGLERDYSNLLHNKLAWGTAFWPAIPISQHNSLYSFDTCKWQCQSICMLEDIGWWSLFCHTTHQVISHMPNYLNGPCYRIRYINYSPQWMFKQFPGLRYFC